MKPQKLLKISWQGLARNKLRSLLTMLGVIIGVGICLLFGMLGMIVFNNTVLPDSNHRLQQLLTEINEKKPTFALKERTVNEVTPSANRRAK